MIDKELDGKVTIPSLNLDFGMSLSMGKQPIFVFIFLSQI